MEFKYLIKEGYWGKLYTVAEFDEQIKLGLKDEDGFGEWSNGTHHSDTEIDPSKFDINNVPPNATHVWFYFH